MNPESLAILDYPALLETLARETHSEPASLLALAVRPDLSPEECRSSWALIDEGRCLLDRRESPDFRDLVDLTPMLRQLGPEGSLLEPLELLVTGQTAAVSRRCVQYFQSCLEEAPLLAQAAGELDLFSPLLENIEKSLGPEGEILDTASPLLHRLRQEQASSRTALTQKLDRLMRSQEFKPLLQDEIITTRGDRFVIPVRAGAAGKSRGLVHDWSNSGATAYLEPMETVEDNNNLAFLKNREKEEIRRIILNLTDQCRQKADSLEAACRILARLDLILAEARLARTFRALTPKYAPGEGFDLQDLRHPLLEARLREQGRRMIPLDLTLSPDAPLMIISGLNTGGKTVALKTLGLALAMAKSGLPVAAAEARIDFPDDILAVMGDGQDLTADLSTFSGHVRAVGRVLAEAGTGTVILLDEIGSGTDPAEGAALGLAVLEKLRTSGAFCLAATHFHLIKSWAALTEGVVSAAVKASSDGQPVYGLSYGSPGFSGGLFMARRLGLPEDIVQRAESYLDDGQRQALALLQRLEDERSRLHEESSLLAQSRRSLALAEEETRRHLQKETQNYRRRTLEQDETVKQALARHRRELAELKNQIRDELKAGQKIDVQAVSLKAAEMAQDLAASRPERPDISQAPPLTEVFPGEMVLIRKLDRLGRVKSWNREKNEILVESQGLSVKTSLAELSAPPASESKPQSRVTFSVTALENESLSLNLLGQTVDEAAQVIDREIDRALLSGRSRLTIIHGLGTGRLRRGIAAYLRTHPRVKEFGHPEEPGGQGVTTVELD